MKIINKTLIGLTLVFALLFASSQTFVGYKSGDFAFNINKTFATGDGGDGGDGGGYTPPAEPTCPNRYTNYPTCGPTTCTNGATNFPACNNQCVAQGSQTQYLSCGSGQSGQITQTRNHSCPSNTWSAWTTTSNTCQNNTCTNGATNYPHCNNNVCTNGATNFPACNICPVNYVYTNGSCVYQTPTCSNGATNYPLCNNNFCTNGATNFPGCNICPTNYVMSSGQCVYQTPTCSNGATNPPYCNICPANYIMTNGQCVYQTPTCSNGAVNFPNCNYCGIAYELKNGTCQPIVYTCTNGATNYPYCNNNHCTNGATNFPGCNICPTNYVMSSGQCVYQTPTCTNGATNYPYCNNNTCTNGATNYPYCNNNNCTNSATNFPSCNICPVGKVYMNGYCQTQIVNPTVDIDINPKNITSGQGANLSWTSNNASSCVISGNGVNYYTTQGNNLIYPTQSGTYTITCQGVNGGSATDTTYINVTQPVQNCNNGATNYPYCNNNTCNNGATNFPACNNNITYVYCNGTQYPAGTICPNINTLTVSTTGANPYQTTATLSGYVNPNGVYPTSIWFEYGTNSNYLNSSTSKVNTGTTGQFTGNLNNLECGRTYYYRAVGSNSNGTRYGDTSSFVTSACPVYTPVLVNNSYVITNLPTNIGYNNAQFNGSWIPGNTSNQLCQAYFNYGTSAYNLNKRTTSQEVYNNQTVAYMSQAAYGLAANTTYYYKAAVVCLDGVKYGNIVSFRTMTPVVYRQTVKKIYIPAPVTRVVQNTKTTVSKAGCTNCAEYTQNLTNNVSVIAGNYMDIVIERLESVAVSGQNANYRIVYKNTSDKSLQNVSVRVVLPEELSMISSERGQYTNGSKTAILTMPVLNPLEEGRFMLTAKVATGFENGRQIVVNGYGQYSVAENNKLTKDEVTAYALSQIGDAESVNNNLNTVKTSNSNSIFGNLFSGNLIELGLLLAILTLFIAALRYVWTMFGKSGVK
jgi:hypothetical protein